MGIRLGIIAVFCVVWALPGAAQAHPMLDRAIEAYEQADFEEALRTFDTAARNADLSVEELLQLFEMRALVHHALGDDAAMRADLGRLAAVRNSYELSRLAPPSVREVFEQVRQANSGANSVELRIEQKTIEESPWMVANVLRVPEGLVDHTTLQCNVDNNARTVSRTSQGKSVSLRLPNSGAHNGCSATARTRQGGVLFTATIEGSLPLATSSKADRFEMPKYKARDEGAQPKKKKKWPWIVAASAVVVAGGITAGVILSQRSDGNQSQAGAVTVNW